MCCTICFDRETEAQIRALVTAVSDAASFRSGILRPSDSFTVITGRGTSVPSASRASDHFLSSSAQRHQPYEQLSLF